MTPVISLAVLLVLSQVDPATQGIEEFTRGDFKEARQHLESAPVTPQSAVFLALTLAAMGECDKATSPLERQFSASKMVAPAAKDAKDLHRLAGLALVQCRISAKEFSAASPVMAQLEKEFPDDADVLYIAATFHMKAWNDSIYRLYRQAPSSYRVNQLSAEVFETQGKYAEAVVEYQHAIEKNPKAVNLHYLLGRAILMQSHDPAALEKARKEFVTALVLNPSDAVAEYQIAQILATPMKGAEAAPHFERAAALRPDFPEALIAVAKLRSEAKRYPEAIALLESAVKLQPRAEGAHYNLMMAYRNAGRPGDAQREKTVLDKLQQPPEGEFADFLKRLGGK